MSRLRRTVLAAIVAVSLVAASALAQAPSDSPGASRHRRPVVLPAGVAGLVSVPLDAEVYRVAAPSLADLRVRDGDGGEVAYVVRRHETTKARGERDVPLRDLQATRAGERRFTLDLGPAPGLHDRVRIRVGDDAKNFRVPVRVETSDDTSDWRVARLAGFVYVVEGETRAADTSVSYPVSSARYVRVTIGPAGGRPLPVTGATIGMETAADREEEPAPVTLVERTEDPKARATRLVLGLGARRPIDRVEIDAADRTFHRVVTVEASDDRTRWRWVGSGSLSAVDTPRLAERHTIVRVPETSAGWIRVSIENLDARPLEVTAVRLAGVRHSLVFEARPGRTYHLEYGNAAARAPQYDLARVLPHLASERLPTATLGPATLLPPPRPRAWTEGRPWLLWSVMAAAVIVLGGLLLHIVRQAPRAPRDDATDPGR